MFYLSSFKNNLYGITDTSDNVEEFYSKNKVIGIASKCLKIEGVEYLSWCDKWQFSIFNSLTKVYKLISVNDNCFKLEQYTLLKGDSINKIKDNVFIELKLDEVLKMIENGTVVDGFQSYLDSRLNVGDKVIYGLSNGKPFLINFKLFNESDYKAPVKGLLDRLKVYNYNYFSSVESAFSCITEKSLIVVNDFYSQLKEVCGSYFASDDSVIMDTFIIQSGHYIPLFRCVPIHFVTILENIILKLTNKEYCFGESGLGYYNPKRNCFTFTSGGRSLTFELGVSAPESKLLLDGNYNWKKDLEKWGVCLVKASLGEKKSCSSDILFYS